MLLSLFASIPIILALGLGVGMAYVKLEHVSSFEGGVGLTVMYITYAIAPVVFLVNAIAHLVASAQDWPRRLITVDAMSILILAPILWFLA